MCVNVTTRSCSGDLSGAAGTAPGTIELLGLPTERMLESNVTRLERSNMTLKETLPPRLPVNATS